MSLYKKSCTFSSYNIKNHEKSTYNIKNIINLINIFRILFLKFITCFVSNSFPHPITVSKQFCNTIKFTQIFLSFERKEIKLSISSQLLGLTVRKEIDTCLILMKHEQWDRKGSCFHGYAYASVHTFVRDVAFKIVLLE